MNWVVVCNAVFATVLGNILVVVIVFVVVFNVVIFNVVVLEEIFTQYTTIKHNLKHIKMVQSVTETHTLHHNTVNLLKLLNMTTTLYNNTNLLEFFNQTTFAW